MNLFTDDPIQSADNDKLQRGPFADQVAKVCHRVHEQGESSVIALIGPWGSGKSSVLNLISASLAKDENWLIGEFNPWLLSDIESLVREFFTELRNLLPAEYQEGKIRDIVRSYANAVAPIASALSLVGVNIPDQVKEIATGLLQGDTSLSKRKKELEDALREAGRPILIILDDLDRLEPDELMMVFKLVRLVGRLPNVYYLLSYDEQTLLDVITQTDLAHGNRERAHNYLEKIVQLRLDLPPLHDKQQLKLINAAFDDVAEKNRVTISDPDQKVLNEAYADVLKTYLDEPRSINRYFAQIDALCPLVGGEVNFTDFTLITFLRTEFPEVHKLIQDHKDELINMASFELGLRGQEKHEDRAKRWREYLEKAGCAEPSRILALLGLMFIPIKAAIQNTSYSSDFYEDLRLGKRIGSQDYFDRYFQFGVPEGDISDQEVNKCLKELTSSSKATVKAAAKWLLSKIVSDPALLLRKLGNEKESKDFPAGAILELLGGGYNTMPEQAGTFGLNPKWDVIRLARQLIGVIEEKDRKTLVESILKTSGGLNMMGDLVDTSIPEKEHIEPEVEAINKKIQTVSSVVVDAMKQYLDELSKKPLDQATDADRTIFYRLSRISGDGMQTITWDFLGKSKWALADFVGWFTPVSTIYGSDGVSHGIGDVSTATLDQMFGLDRLISDLSDELNAEAKQVQARDNPTIDNRREYMLNVLREVRASRQSEKQVDATDEPGATPVS